MHENPGFLEPGFCIRDRKKSSRMKNPPATQRSKLLLIQKLTNWRASNPEIS